MLEIVEVGYAVTSYKLKAFFYKKEAYFPVSRNSLP